MITAPSLASVQQQVAQRLRLSKEPEPKVRLVGLLIAPFDAPLSRDEIVPRLGQYHFASGRGIDFYLAGYFRYVPADQLDSYAPDARDAGRAPGEDATSPPWFYSDRLQQQFCRDLAKAVGGKWSPSGEVDLILLQADAREGASEEPLLFTSFLSINLTKALADGAIPSIAEFFQRIFAFAHDADSDSPLHRFGGREQAKTAGLALLDACLSVLPEGLRGLWKKERHFRIVTAG